jgi:hypothetical protein
MLSHDLDAYASHFREWHAAGGASLDRRVCDLFRRLLTEAAEQARILEGRPVPPALRGELPAGVINLDIERDARQAGAA